MQSEVNFQSRQVIFCSLAYNRKFFVAVALMTKRVSAQQVDFAGKQNSLAFLLIFTGLSCIFIVSMPEKEERYEIYSK